MERGDYGNMRGFGQTESLQRGSSHLHAPSFNNNQASTLDSWYAAGVANCLTLAGVTAVVGRLYCVAQYIDRDMKIDKLTMETTTGGAGAVMRLGIYEPSYEGYYPGRMLCMTDSLDGSGIGPVTGNVTVNLLGGRTYWFFFHQVSGTAAVMRAVAQGAQTHHSGLSSIASGIGSGYYIAMGGALPPSPFWPGSTKSTTVNIPVVFYHVAS